MESMLIARIPSIEDEIRRAWLVYCEDHPGRSDAMSCAVFEAGFRAARTFIQTGATGRVT